MQKSNYALITALYSNGESGLYSDVYFPIIKYAIIKYFASKPLTEAFGQSVFCAGGNLEFAIDGLRLLAIASDNDIHRNLTFNSLTFNFFPVLSEVLVFGW